MSRPRARAEKRARRATFAAKRTIERHAELERRAVGVIDGLSAEVKLLRETQERFRALLFAAFLGKALGDEPKVTDAFMGAFPQWFASHPDEPWRLFELS